MKKITLSVLTALVLTTTVVVNPIQAANTTKMEIVTIPTTTGNWSEEESILLNRLEEIKAMDKSKLSVAEKRDLRKELRTIKKNIKVGNGGIYLSVGAIIIIILLLILIL